MTTEPTLFVAAMAVGVLGAVHCVGMCSGIAGTLSIGTQGLALRSKALRTVAYNSGRIASYMAAGALAGAAGQTIGGVVSPETAMTVARTVSAAFAILLALYILGRDRVLIHIERAGAVLWRRLQPLGKRFLPVNNTRQALGLGLVWGWLPCGLVYSMLIWSAASGSALGGALVMLGFGIGTLPALTSMGMAGSWILELRRKPAVRYVAATLLVAVAVISLMHGYGQPHGEMVAHQ